MEGVAEAGRRFSLSRDSFTGCFPPDTIRGCRCLDDPSRGPGGPNWMVWVVGSAELGGTVRAAQDAARGSDGAMNSKSESGEAFASVINDSRPSSAGFFTVELCRFSVSLIVCFLRGM